VTVDPYITEIEQAQSKRQMAALIRQAAQLDSLRRDRRYLLEQARELDRQAAELESTHN
jgi:hypothetical protein